VQQVIKQFLTFLNSNPKAKQVLGLFSVNIIGIPIGIITSIIITRYLGAKLYGDYKFINSIFSFTIIIFSFGFFQAGNRALVLNTDKKKGKEYYGAELLIVLGVYVIMSVSLILYAFFDINLQKKQLSNYLLYIIPFGWIFLLPRYFETLFQADNRIKLLAQVRLYPKLGFLITALLIYFLFSQSQLNKLGVIWSFYLATQAFVFLYVLVKLQVSFRNIKTRLRELWFFNKSYGLNVYTGSLFALGFAALTEVLISYFGIDNTGVGFYALAITFTLPLSFIPNTIATTHYKDFSVSSKIPGKLFLLTLGLSLLALMGLWLLVGPFVRFFYGTEFESVIKLNFIVSFGVTAHGLADFFNRFLGAHGQGKALRNTAFLVGSTMMLFNLLLIPQWAETGAAFAKLFSGIVYLGIIVWQYKKFEKKLQT
jgi:O-antigen/teichoic acid export membrane protein